MMSVLTYAKRVALGIGVMIVGNLLVDLFRPTFFEYQFRLDQFFFFFQWLPFIEGALWTGLIIFSGAYVARVRFVIPAIGYFVVLSVTSFHMLQRIAKSVQPMPYDEVVARNSLGAALTLLVIVAAAEMGTAFAKRKANKQSSSDDSVTDAR